MSQGNKVVPPDVLNEMMEMIQGMGDFSPCIIYLKELDLLTVFEEDCSYTEEQRLGSGIGILTKNHGDDAGKIVGVVIHDYSRWKHDD